VRRKAWAKDISVAVYDALVCCELMGVRTPTVNRELADGPAKAQPRSHTLRQFPRSDFASDSQLFGGWERRFTTFGGAIHNLDPSIHNLIHKFWQENSSNGDLCTGIAIRAVFMAKVVHEIVNGGVQIVKRTEKRCE